MSTSTPRNLKFLEWIGLVLVLALAAYTRLANSVSALPIYSDEGTWLEMTRHLLNGEVGYMAFRGVAFQSIAKMPVFTGLLWGVSALFGLGLNTLRILTGILGIVSVLALFLVLRAIEKEQRTSLPLLAALMLTLYPHAILYSRLGFSYNLLAPCFVLLLFSLWRFLETDQDRWILLASMIVGFGAVTDLMMLSAAPVVAIVGTYRRWRLLPWIIGLVIAPWIIYVGIAVARGGDAFLFDLQWTFSRLSTLPLPAQPVMILINLGGLLKADSWIIPALVGLWLLKNPRLRMLALLVYLGSLLGTMRTVTVVGLSGYYLQPLTPFVALGIANLVLVSAPYLIAFSRHALQRLFRAWNVPGESWPVSRLEGWSLTVFSSLLLFALIIGPLLFQLGLTVLEIQNGFSPSFRDTMVPYDDAKAAADYVNARITPESVVLASPMLVWMIDSNAADFQFMVTITGQESQHFPGNIPRERFVFNTDYHAADYVIVDNLWRGWASVNMEEVAEAVAVIETWPLAFQSGEVEVYQNPDLP